MSAQKKIMFLGGIYYLKPAIDAAHALGCYVITCDNVPNNIAHQWSDEYVNASIIDKEEILRIAREKKIDGILSYAVDPGVLTAAYVAEQLRLPNVGPYKSVKILQNKALFRQYLHEHNFNVPKAKGYYSVQTAYEDRDNWDYPVIVKPVDSAGSKGVTRVNNTKELLPALELAYKSSLGAKEIIIEEFIDLSGYQSGSDSFSVDGEMVFMTYDDQYFDSASPNPYTPALHIWPSTMPTKSQDILKAEIQRLITLLGMKTSLYNIEARVGTNGKPYIMELSPRAGGNRLSEVLRMATGQDIVMATVKAALGEKVNIQKAQIDGYWADIILHTSISGKFVGIEMSDEILPNVKDVVSYKEKGQEVFGFTAANEAIGSVFLRFDTKEQLVNIVNNLRDYIRIIVK